MECAEACWLPTTGTPLQAAWWTFFDKTVSVRAAHQLVPERALCLFPSSTQALAWQGKEGRVACLHSPWPVLRSSCMKLPHLIFPLPHLTGSGWLISAFIGGMLNPRAPHVGWGRSCLCLEPLPCSFISLSAWWICVPPGCERASPLKSVCTTCGLLSWLASWSHSLCVHHFSKGSVRGLEWPYLLPSRLWGPVELSSNTSQIWPVLESLGAPHSQRWWSSRSESTVWENLCFWRASGWFWNCRFVGSFSLVCLLSIVQDPCFPGNLTDCLNPNWFLFSQSLSLSPSFVFSWSLSPTLSKLGDFLIHVSLRGSITNFWFLVQYIR